MNNFFRIARVVSLINIFVLLVGIFFDTDSHPFFPRGDVLLLTFIFNGMPSLFALVMLWDYKEVARDTLILASVIAFSLFFINVSSFL